MDPAEPRTASAGASRPWWWDLRILDLRALRTLEWRLPAIEAHPGAVAFVQTLGGRLVLFALFGVFMRALAGRQWLSLTLCACVVSLAGRYRRLAAVVCTGAMLVIAPGWFEFGAVSAVLQQQGLDTILPARWLRAGTLLAFVPVVAAALLVARHARHHPLTRRPVLAQHVVYLTLLAVAVSPWLRGVPEALVWSALAVFSAYFWFLAYALIDQRHRRPQPLLLQFATFHPFFGSTTTPLGKGAANWSRVEPTSADDLAVTQLKGIKLLVWALVLEVVLRAFRRGAYGVLGIPTLRRAFETFVETGATPAYGLLSVVTNFPEQLLGIAVWGHVIIATARIAGFRLLRNTCRPLSSRSVAEFWNRFYYYFKEILVDVYFYPTYLRWFKRHRRLRIAFATFMAAGVGNFFFHFIRDNHLIAEHGVKGALVHSQTYGFYCLLLVAGIVLSQLRARRIPPEAGWLRGRFLPCLGVAVFYCFLSFFDGPMRHAALDRHLAFLLQVLGVTQWIG